jgi:shikimate kinase
MDPRATLQALVERRAPLYAAAAHVTVDTSDIGSKEVAEQALAEAKRSFAERVNVAS